MREPGYFHPHTLLRHVGEGFDTYLRSAEYFYGQRPEPGTITCVKAGTSKRALAVDADEEYRFAMCLLAEQHELFHVHQFISTTVGMGIFILDAIRADVERKFVHDIQVLLDEKHRGQATSLTSLGAHYPQLAQVLEEFDGPRRALRTLFSILDYPELDATVAIRAWNATVDVLDEAALQPADDIKYARFRVPFRAGQANPDRVTLRSLFECSARCRDLTIIRGWRLQDSVSSRLSYELATGAEYNALFPIAAELVPLEVLPLALCRLCGLALQAPLLSVHVDPNNLVDCLWEDVVPTWRFRRIVDHLQESGETPDAIIEDPDLPDRICDALDWPRVSTLLERAVSNDFFRGMDALTCFATDQHLSFCELATHHAMRPVWLPELLMRAKSPDDLDISPFYPPFHFAGNEIVTHPTCTDMKAMIDILLIYATSTAASEFLDDKGLKLPKTHSILDSYRRWVGRRSPAVERLFVETMVPSWFQRLLGFLPRGYEATA